MRIVLAYVMIWALAMPAMAQDEDSPGYLVGLLQDALSGAGREVRITGFEGALSSTARLEQMTIADDAGVWMTLRDVTLDWTRSALLRGRVEVNALTAASLDIPRPPNAGPGAPPKPEATPFSLPDLPVSVNIGTFEIERITLGEAVLGQALAVRVAGRASLAEGAGEVDLRADRVGDLAGSFAVAGSLDAAGTNLVLNLDVQEDAGGLVSTSIGLPGAPSVALTVAGAGPLSDFGADLTMATDGQERLAGRVTLATQGPVEAPVRVVNVDIGGDLAPLFAPDYAVFFGDAVALRAAATQTPDGAVDLSDLTLSARSLSLQGRAALDANNWPRLIDLTGEIRDDAGGPVLLPLAGTPTRVDRVGLSVQYDATVSEVLEGRFDVTALDRADVQVTDAGLTLDATMATAPEGAGVLDARVRAQVRGIAGLDPALAEALGADMRLSTDITYATDAPLVLRNLDVTAGPSRLTGSVQADDLGADMRADVDLELKSGDLSRFAALAGQPLSGAAEASVAGRIFPLSGAFDLTLEAVTQAVAIGVAQADALLAGLTTLSVAAARDTEGLRLDGLDLRNDEISLEASGTLGGQAADVTYALAMREVAVVAPGVTGPLQSEGRAILEGDVWDVDVTASGPFGATLDVEGAVTGPDTDMTLAAVLPSISVFVPELNGPLNIDANVRRPNADYEVTATVAGVAGLQAQVDGTVSPDGAPDLRLAGGLPLALARPFITPRAIDGTAQFDLALRDGFGLEALSGQVSVRDGRVTDPGLRLVLEALSADVALAGGRANVDVSTQNRAGGSLAVTGGVGLTGAQTADIAVRLGGFVIADPQLYQTSIDGTVNIAGPLAGPQVTGTLTLGQTDIVVPSTGFSGLADIPQITHIGATNAVQQTRRRAGLIADETTGGGGGGTSIGLDVSVLAPSRIFVRGRGLDAELGGQLRVTGTTADPISAGAFQLIRGRIDILQERYNLEEGLIQLQGSLEPFLRFVAATQTSTGTARVIVEGDASEPEVSFTSEPEAPEEEVLAQLLFDRNLSEMSAFQALQLANAVAILSGRGGLDIISNLRENLGLDDFDVTTTEDGGTEFSAGKYISDNAYTDVTVDSEGNSEVSLNIDLTPNFTARGSVGADGNSALGVFFERDY